MHVQDTASSDKGLSPRPYSQRRLYGLVDEPSWSLTRALVFNAPNDLSISVVPVSPFEPKLAVVGMNHGPPLDGVVKRRTTRVVAH